MFPRTEDLLLWQIKIWQFSAWANRWPIFLGDLLSRITLNYVPSVTTATDIFVFVPNAVCNPEELSRDHKPFIYVLVNSMKLTSSLFVRPTEIVDGFACFKS